MNERLDAESLTLLKEDLARLQEDAESFGERFYLRLFDLHPELCPLFRTPRTRQSRHLVAGLAAIVRSLHDGELTESLLEALAAVHVGYGVERAHYPWIGENLIACLREMLAAHWTPAHEEAWVEAYAWIQDIIDRAIGSMSGPMPARGASKGG